MYNGQVEKKWNPTITYYWATKDYIAMHMILFLNQAQQAGAPGFLELFQCGRLYVCVSAPEAINN